MNWAFHSFYVYLLYMFGHALRLWCNDSLEWGSWKNWITFDKLMNGDMSLLCFFVCKCHDSDIIRLLRVCVHLCVMCWIYFLLDEMCENLNIYSILWQNVESCVCGTCHTISLNAIEHTNSSTLTHISNSICDWYVESDWIVRL